MRKNSRLIGDTHVLQVYEALSKVIKKEKLNNYPETVKQTAYFISAHFPNLESVTSKFHEDNNNQAKDLTLILKDQEKISVNLFLIGKRGKIQPKNPGAKSFFSKYFLNNEIQKEFNRVFEEKYLEYLRSIVSIKMGVHYISDKKVLKKLISLHYPKFSTEINKYRDRFLYCLRETCFDLLKNSYNKNDIGFFNAYNILFMTSDFNVITYYGKNEDDVEVVEFNPGKPNFNDIQIYKIGKNTVGIKYGEVGLTLRFKFESNPISSIKLAVSYEKFHNETNIRLKNMETVKKMDLLLSIHEYNDVKNSSNAIGKCHEALTYYYFLKKYPEVIQEEYDECVSLLEKYYSNVKPEVLNNLFKSTSTIIPVIEEKLKEKYNNFQLENIALVPESYISDRLDTGDLQLILKVNKFYIEEKISLKALSKKGKMITTKNPGIGTILGPSYFDVGDINNTVNEVKLKFIAGDLDHDQCLIIIAGELGEYLKKATQEQLRRGIESLLGKATMAVTFYEDGLSYCVEHSKIMGEITLHVRTPSLIRNTLKWNNNQEELCLRVKFSRGKKYGWSSIKLASEYKIF
jgi:hypothetical protein